ncbi:hypothetical protein [Kaistella carnis]|nr:hypothetical protein [Kaistella carnis]
MKKHVENKIIFMDNFYGYNHLFKDFSNLSGENFDNTKRLYKPSF